MSTLRLDPGYQRAVAPLATIFRCSPPKDTASLRFYSNAGIAGMMSASPAPLHMVEETKLQYTSADGTQLALYRFNLSAAQARSAAEDYRNMDGLSDSSSNSGDAASAGSAGEPAILYIHSGGFVSGSVPLFRNDMARYVCATGRPVFAPAYRLAPECPFPAAAEDAYAALAHLRDHAAELGIDPARIAVVGVSAGGGIAAGVALMARDRAFAPPVARLLLLAPMLDDRTRVAADSPLAAYLTWPQELNDISWRAYVGEAAGTAENNRAAVSPYAAPARAADVSGLPSTYIDVGGLDLFRDESLAFGARLAAANVETELHLYPGVPHAWEWVSGSAAVTRKAMANRSRVLRDV